MTMGWGQMINATYTIANRTNTDLYACVDACEAVHLTTLTVVEMFIQHPICEAAIHNEPLGQCLLSYVRLVDARNSPIADTKWRWLESVYP